MKKELNHKNFTFVINKNDILKPKQVVHTTILISTIHFDLVCLGFGLRSTKLNIALIEHNPWPRLCSINVLFDFSRLG
jgi:hypothetical protein